MRWPVVYQQTRRWLAAGCFETLVEDLRHFVIFACLMLAQLLHCIASP